LKAYKEREGDCRVNAAQKENGYALGRWVSKQRTNQYTMPVKNRQRLEVIGFIWDPLEVDWEEGFSYLKAYKEREGGL
jgi:hypothetical protein